jgi:hypothetical protein
MTNDLSPKPDLRPLCRLGHDFINRYGVYSYGVICRNCPLVVSAHGIHLHGPRAIKEAERDFAIQELES